MHADPLASYAYRWFGGLLDRATIDRHFAWFWNHLRRTADEHDIIVAANAQLARRLDEGGVRGSAGIVTIPMGIDRGLFSPGRRDLELRRAMLASCGLGADATLLIAIGRHSPEKRWPTVVDAAQMAGVSHRVALLLVGDGTERARILRRVGGNPHIQLLAPVRDRPLLAAMLASADALIHGCESETFGMVAAEAAASGLPLIVPDEGGARDLATPAHAEFYRAGDSRSAARAIERLIAREPEALRAAAAAAAARVPTMRAHFDALFARYAALTAARRRPLAAAG
jgi:alpha-1,6-mannosyltransferase